jgi:C1A family cysteine protease
MWYKRPGDYYLGGHAMTIVGYDGDGFIIRNSWSSQWGESGYTFYQFKDFGMHWEIWTAIDANSNSLTLAHKAAKNEDRKGLFRKSFYKKC